MSNAIDEEAKQPFFNQIQIVDPNATELLCEICYDTKPIENFFKYDCGHMFCKDCEREQMQFHIGRADLSKLKCSRPQCGCKVTEDQIRELFKE
jgi:late competence protein required for DNA uptake (superfamily II DNA/RNA helicase)